MRQIKLSEANKEVKVVDGKLFFGNKEVRDCEFIKPESVAALYMVRHKDSNGFWSIVTGFDLIGDKFWLGGIDTRFFENGSRVKLPPAFYDDMQSIERVINTIGDKSYVQWEIFEEEDFERMQNEMSEEWYNEQ